LIDCSGDKVGVATTIIPTTRAILYERTNDMRTVFLFLVYFSSYRYRTTSCHIWHLDSSGCWQCQQLETNNMMSVWRGRGRRASHSRLTSVPWRIVSSAIGTHEDVHIDILLMKQQATTSVVRRENRRCCISLKLNALKNQQPKPDRCKFWRHCCIHILWTRERMSVWV
jgi:hypothetical protein